MNSTEIIYLDPSAVHPSPLNPREDLGDVTEMADSMRTMGIIEPLTVRKHPDLEGDYEIIAGHRRYAAAQQAGLYRLPCLIVEADERKMRNVFAIENSHRTGLTKSEQGKNYQGMLDLGLSIYQIAKDTGHKSETIQSRITLANLSERTQAKVDSGKATLERVMKVAEFEEYPELQQKLETTIDSYEFDFQYRQASEEKHWQDWKEPAFLNLLDNLGFTFLTVEETRLPQYSKITDADLRETFPSDPETVASLTADHFGVEIMENLDSYRACFNSNVRAVHWYRVDDQVETAEPAGPSAEELAEQQAREKAETALRVARTLYVEHLRGLMTKPKYAKGTAVPVLAHVMADEGWKSKSYALVLGIDVGKENLDYFEEFQAFTADQLALAMLMVNQDFTDPTPARELFSVESFNPSFWNYCKQTKRRSFAYEHLGWQETEGEQLARLFWSPETTSAIEDEVNF